MDSNGRDAVIDPEHGEHRVAYSPIPKGIIKKEPTSDEEDNTDCELIAYSRLPSAAIKGESECGDGHDGFNYGIMVHTK